MYDNLTPEEKVKYHEHKIDQHNCKILQEEYTGALKALYEDRIREHKRKIIKLTRAYHLKH